MLKVWLLSVVALYFCVLIILMPFSPIRCPAGDLAKPNLPRGGGQPSEGPPSIQVLAVPRSSEAAHSFAGLADVAHGYGP